MARIRSTSFQPQWGIRDIFMEEVTFELDLKVTMHLFRKGQERLMKTSSAYCGINPHFIPPLIIHFAILMDYFKQTERYTK